MEIWIRSQNRKNLVTCTDIRLLSNAADCKIWDFNADVILGTYKSEERALEVLDEIEEQLGSIMEMIETEGETQYKTCRVFHMPSQEEAEE